MHSSIVNSITNTKLATVLLTLGRKLKPKDSIFIQYDRDTPPSTGGKAHFLFDTNIRNDIHRDAKVYEAGTADTYLEEFVASLDLPDTTKANLEQAIYNAYLVIGRRVLDNYQVVVRDLKTVIAKVVVTGGTPVHGKDGEFVGIQDFSIRIVK